MSRFNLVGSHSNRNFPEGGLLVRAQRDGGAVKDGSGAPAAAAGHAGAAAETTVSTGKRIKFALVDSGMGGGMTAAFLRGEVRQLGSYFCLPIGEKPAAQAEAFTAAMALWPLVAPLSDSQGGAGVAARHVIIACNSASVRKDGAIELIRNFCRDVAQNSDAYNLSDEVIENIKTLHEKIEAKPNYLENHIHEIVSKTAEAGVDKIDGTLKEKDTCFVRIDSTEGTANSLSYPTKMGALLAGRHGEISSKQTRNVVTVNGTNYTVTHTVFGFEMDGRKKTVVVEGRGNDPWVPAIEGNRLVELGETLVADSLQASQAALRQAGEQLGADEGLADLFGTLEKRPPDCSMLCCTHYPAMKELLAGQYDAQEKGVTDFINQAAIVRELAKTLDAEALSPEKGPLDLNLTVGSRKRGGGESDEDESVSDGDASAGFLYNVLDMTLAGDGGNDPSLREIGNVRIYVQDGAGNDTGQPPVIGSREKLNGFQDQYEYIHQFMGWLNGDKILAEQGLEGKYTVGADGHRVLKSVRPLAETERRQPSERVRDLADTVPAAISAAIDRVALQVTRGETRGLDRIAALVDNGRQLRAGVAQLKQVLDYNEEARAKGLDPQRVGILTGFSVVDNATGDRVGGENDGPAGAVTMARTMVERGLPVVLVTDRSGEAALASALVGAGLATVISETPADERRFGEDIMIKDEYRRLIAWEIPHFTNIERSTKEDRQANAGMAVRDSVGRLARMNVSTVIAIERPSVTEVGNNLFSMVAKDVSNYNLDMSPLVLPEESLGWNPVTIGVGDGGNEIGTGGIADFTMTGRGPDLRPLVRHGHRIAAKKEHATDVMLLGSVSNNVGVALSLSWTAALHHWEERGDREALEAALDSTIDGYNSAIQYMYGEGMSLDGVSKQNELTVDGRRLGTAEEARARHAAHAARGAKVPLGRDATTGADETTHNDRFLRFRNELLAG